MGNVDVYIDGVLAQADIDAYAPSTTKQVVLYQNSNLLNGSHTIKVVCKGTKNASSSNTICALDAFASISAPDQTAYYKLVNKNSGKVMDVTGGSYEFRREYYSIDLHRCHQSALSILSKQQAATTKS